MEIVRTTRYQKDLKRLGVSLNERAGLETAISNDPTAGDVIKGTGGLRKIRFAFGGRGKRGGGRSIYFLFLSEDTAIMLAAYAKNEKSDLTDDDRKTLTKIAKEFGDG
jgi:hypothetical protein